MAKISAGLLMYRFKNKKIEFLLVHPGGPFWKNKNMGTWSIPKGGVGEGEEEFETAKREFKEETGLAVGDSFLPLTEIQQKGGKIVKAWGFEGDCDPKKITSETFEMEWPPKSGKKELFPEVDRAEFFEFEEAKEKINPAQIAFLEELLKKVKDPQ